MLFCGWDKLPCYNRGTCPLDSYYYDPYYYDLVDNPLFENYENYLGELDGCQCSHENGLAKYHGESCEMPGSDACAGSPCQNGGTCTTIIQGEIQACFIKI